MATKKFCQIGQVCTLTGLPHSTIRFWEKSFPALQPMRSSGGHRYYNMEQVALLQYLKKLLHQEGYTIDGAKKRLATEKKPIEDTPSPPAADDNVLAGVKSGLEEILILLKEKTV